jgi:hypothetical protein
MEAVEPAGLSFIPPEAAGAGVTALTGGRLLAALVVDELELARAMSGGLGALRAPDEVVGDWLTSEPAVEVSLVEIAPIAHPAHPSVVAGWFVGEVICGPGSLGGGATGSGWEIN